MKLFNIKKNLNNICFVLTQPGSIFYLEPLLNKIKSKSIFVEKKISHLCNGKFSYNLINKKNLSEVLKYNVIITNLTQYDYFEKEILRLKKKDNYLIQFLDNWNFVKERLYYSNLKKKFPNEIWSLDKLTNYEIKKSCKNKQVKFKYFSHPGISNIQKYKKNDLNEIKKKVLIILQPLNTLFLNNKHIQFNFDQNDIFDVCEKVKKKNKSFNFTFALHPLMKSIVKPKLKFIRLKDTSEILHYTHIIGFFSTILSTSMKLSIPSGIFRLNNEKYYLNKNMKNVFFIKNELDLEKFLNKKFRKINKKINYSDNKILSRISELNQHNS